MIRHLPRTAALWLALCLPHTAAMADQPATPAPAAPAAAAPASLTIETPNGWDHLPGLSRTVAQSASETDFFGVDEAFQSGALAYGRANRGALYLTWADTVRTQPSPEASVRAAFDELHQAPYLASPEPGSTQEVAYRERNFDGVAEMQFEWAHMSNGTINVLRALGWKDANNRVHLAVAECVLQSESIGEFRPHCETSLGSLSLTKESGYQALSTLPDPKRVGSAALADFEVPKLKTGDLSPSDTMSTAPAQMGEVLYQGRPKTKEDNNNRFLIAIGVLLLGVAVYLTTRSTPGAKGEDQAEDESEDDEKEQV